MNTVLAFTLVGLAGGEHLQFALICAEARYASIASAGGDPIRRRFVTAANWRQLARTLSLGLEPGPLQADHVVSLILVDEKERKGTIVQYMALQSLEFDSISAAVVLDAHLRAMASRPVR